VEAIKYLAWHLIHCCDDLYLYEKLTSFQSDDRERIIQAINGCLSHGSPINTVLTKDHLVQITDVLFHGNSAEVTELHFDLTMYVLAFGLKKIRSQLEKLYHEEY
jgi:hypothetical protein